MACPPECTWTCSTRTVCCPLPRCRSSASASATAVRLSRSAIPSAVSRAGWPAARDACPYSRAAAAALARNSPPSRASTASSGASSARSTAAALTAASSPLPRARTRLSTAPSAWRGTPARASGSSLMTRLPARVRPRSARSSCPSPSRAAGGWSLRPAPRGLGLDQPLGRHAGEQLERTLEHAALEQLLGGGRVGLLDLEDDLVVDGEDRHRVEARGLERGVQAGERGHQRLGRPGLDREVDRLCGLVGVELAPAAAEPAAHA